MVAVEVGLMVCERRGMCPADVRAPATVLTEDDTDVDVTVAVAVAAATSGGRTEEGFPIRGAHTASVAYSLAAIHLDLHFSRITVDPSCIATLYGECRELDGEFDPVLLSVGLTGCMTEWQLLFPPVRITDSR